MNNNRRYYEDAYDGCNADGYFDACWMQGCKDYL